MHSFRYLNVSLVFILGFVGLKMLLTDVIQVDTLLSLAVIAGMLAVGVVASLAIKSGEPSEGLAGTGNGGVPDPEASLAANPPADSSSRLSDVEQVRHSRSD
jgi:hypothetical protein